jgi:hypothetical protein
MDSLLAKTTDRLSETRRTLADTERVGASRALRQQGPPVLGIAETRGSHAATRYAGGAVLSDLDGQRRKLEASRDKLHQADENIGMAMQVMRRMKNRYKTPLPLCFSRSDCA